MKNLWQLLMVIVMTIPAFASATVTIEGTEYRVFDPHLHFGNYSDMRKSGKEFIIEAMPEFARLYSPPALDLAVDPYAQNVGIAEQFKMSGVDRGVILAVYTQNTNGYATNWDLQDHLLNELNVTDDGKALFHGMVSINFDDLDDASLFEERLEAMESYLIAHPDLVVGIKLAHAHQGVALNDERYYALFDVAATYQVPVLLHTGFTPSPNSSDTPEFYDPSYLESVITSYNGEGSNPLVVFIFAHAGQGDARSVNNALEMCRDNENIFLDLSALKREFSIDKDGNPISEEDQLLEENASQLPYVLQKIKEYNLFDRALFATDGPQYSGFLKSYLTYFIEEMQAAEYDQTSMQKLLYDNAVGLLLNED